MSGDRAFTALGFLGLLAVVVGGVGFAIFGEVGTVVLVLLWGGLLALLLFFYVKFADIRTLVAKRSTRYGANMAFMIAVFVAIIGLIGTMSVRYKVRTDLTENQRYSLSPQTIKVLKSLDRDVEAIAFYRSDERTRQAMVDLLQEYSYHTPKFSFWFIDPDKKPLEAAKYGVTAYRTTLLRSGGKQQLVGFESEEKISNALLRVIRDQVKVVYFVTGHGENRLASKERTGYLAAKTAIEKENYEVRELLLASAAAVPEDATVVVVAGPKKDLLAEELDKLAAYVERGGSLFVLVDPSPTTELSGFLESYGFKLGNDIIVDKRGQMVGANYLSPVVMEYSKKHAIVKDFNVVTVFPVARSVTIAEDPTKGQHNLAKTGSSSWARSQGTLEEDNVKFNPDKDQRGPINILSVRAVGKSEGGRSPTAKKTSKIDRWGRIVVAGDSDFAGNAHIKLMGNRDLFLNVINWLAEETAMISVRAKLPGLTPLTMTDQEGRVVFWVSVIIAPSLALVLGVGVVARRRRQT